MGKCDVFSGLGEILVSFVALVFCGGETAESESGVSGSGFGWLVSLISGWLVSLISGWLR